MALGQDPHAPPATAGRAGRNLPAAILVGVALALLITVPLFTYRPLFVVVVAVTVAFGVREVARALTRLTVSLPLPPLVAGAIGMMAGAYVGGAAALFLGLIVTVLACAGWVLRRPAEALLRDLAGCVFTAFYVPYLAGFAALLTMPDDGALRVVAFIATTAGSDIGGYAAGVLAGRHPMAPTVSPKKSWEGFGGSVLVCALAGAIFLPVFFHAAVWQGIVYGLAVVVTATLGDLGESMIKRDIGIKDMGALLPGHGGIMDRLDSLLPTAPVAWLLLTAFAPPS